MHLKTSDQRIVASGQPGVSLPATRHSPLTTPMIRVSLAEVESRAAIRKPGYVEAFKAAATLDPDGEHLTIPQETLRQIWAEYTAPGLGDELLNGGGCCGG